MTGVSQEAIVPPTTELLTAQEAADRYRVSAKTIIRLINRGVIPAIKVGKQWRIRQAELDEAFSARPRPPRRPRSKG